MKNSYKILVLGIMVAFMASCTEDFLVRNPYGSTITQGQYEQLANKLEGSMRGIYSMMYSSSDHDEFGERSIDMYGDLLCGDMALQSYTYGWFYTDEQGLGRTSRTGYLWSYYYGMLHNVNAVIYAAQGGDAASADNVIKRVAANGLPTTYSTKDDVVTYYTISGTDTLATFTEAEAKVANCYAQALAVRGYIYSNLIMLYCPESNDIDDFTTELCFPIYDENHMDEAQPLAFLSDVYTMVESDLTNAIAYFHAFSTIERDEATKLEINEPVACGILAYSYLNKAKSRGNSNGDAYKKAYTNARDYALRAISSSKASVLPNSQLYSTGFNNVSICSWMWGQDVTVETATGLASFFGQVDIHSYSYAWAGDTKAIDENLYKLIPDFDGRKNWFNDGKENGTYKYCPDRKFYSAASPNSTKADDIDREWLSDNVFMRIESMYLIAAEASYRLKNDNDAITYLTTITDQRVMEGKDAEYAAYKATLDHSNLIAAIEYNWRVEMWGEGYGLQTFRRIGAEAIALDEANKRERHRGANHSANGGSKIEPGIEYTFQIPSSETTYNDKITTEL